MIVYTLFVTTTAGRTALRDRLYKAYASQHAGCGSGMATALIYRRDIRPLLPACSAGQVIDIECGQGELVKLLLADGYDAHGVDVSPDQVAIAHAAGLDRVRQGDYRDTLLQLQNRLAAVTATDLLEHLTKDELLDTLDRVVAAMATGGVFIARVPNAVSPFGGHIRYGDFTHESSYTTKSVQQVVAAAGFCSVAVKSSPPVAHGLISAARAAAWKLASVIYKAALAVETRVLRGNVASQNLASLRARPDEGPIALEEQPQRAIICQQYAGRLGGARSRGQLRGRQYGPRWLASLHEGRQSRHASWCSTSRAHQKCDAL